MPFPGTVGSAWAADTWATSTWDDDAWAGAGTPPDPVLGTLSRATIAIGVGISLVLALLMPVALGG
jgi:hypothetical protein